MKTLATLGAWVGGAFFGTVLFASAAQADLSGNWLGWGEWNYQGSGTRCSVVRFSFREDESKIERLGGRFDCDFVALEVAPLIIQKQGVDLWVNGTRVGSSDGQNYAWAEAYNENVKIEVSIHREAGHLDYAERWVEAGDQTLYEIRARVFIGNANATSADSTR